MDVSGMRSALFLVLAHAALISTAPAPAAPLCHPSSITAVAKESVDCMLSNKLQALSCISLPNAATDPGVLSTATACSKTQKCRGMLQPIESAVSSCGVPTVAQELINQLGFAADFVNEYTPDQVNSMVESLASCASVDPARKNCSLVTGEEVDDMIKFLLIGAAVVVALLFLLICCCCCGGFAMCKGSKKKETHHHHYSSPPPSQYPQNNYNSYTPEPEYSYYDDGYYGYGQYAADDDL
eukprot:NODE_4288_length_796_cov_44.083707_g4265_i0.p1 GENE.NODE_4288_length_796_cov_44.083707_g4265_i0~~NODE_4288_length_796_cov_44.083707_g4265_i0.p1  ORF type:complete len:257 (-),score=38.32 NODE_4288_length_796_cov_44.083707_g4265_i0:25-744(-)